MLTGSPPPAPKPPPAPPASGAEDELLRQQARQLRGRGSLRISGRSGTANNTPTTGLSIPK